MNTIIRIFAICLLAVVSMAQAQTVDEIADSAYDEMDREVAKVETERQARQQAEFQAYVKAEMNSFRCDMAKVCTDTAFVNKFMAKLSANIDEIVCLPKRTLCEKRGYFTSVIGDMRKKIGLSAPVPADTTTKVIIEKEVFVTSRLVSQAEINQSRKNADWSKNTAKKNLPKKWWEKKGVFTSPDGKVTFAVGIGISRDMGIAGEKAVFDGRTILTIAGAPSGAVSEVRKHMGEEGSLFKTFALMAIPTFLLDKK